MSGQIDIRNSGADWHVDPEATVEVKPDPGVNNALPNQDDSVHWYNNRLPAQTTTPPNLPSLKN